MTDEHNDVMRQLHAAAVSPGVRASVHAVAQQALNDGLSSETVYDLLMRLYRTDLSEAVSEQVEDVMNLVWGWCAPSDRMRKQT